MDLSVMDSILSIALLVALYVIIRFRTTLRNTDSEYYRLILGSVCILTLVAALRIMDAAGISFGPAFLSAPIFFELFIGIVTLTAVTLLLIGIVRWMHAGRAATAISSMSGQQTEFFQSVHRPLDDDHSPHQALRATLELMVNSYDLDFGAVVVRSEDTGTLALLATAGPAGYDEALLQDIAVAVDTAVIPQRHTASDGSPLLKDVPSGLPKPDMVLPVLIEHQVEAAYLLWQGESKTLDAAARQELMLGVKMIAMKVRMDDLNRNVSASRDIFRWLDSVPVLQESGALLAENMAGIADWLTAVIPADLVSFTIAYNHKNLQRYSIGRDRNVLAEKHVDTRSHRRFMDYVLCSASPLLINDTAAKTAVPIDGVFKHGDICSLLAAPLGGRSFPNGMVVLAAQQANSFTSVHVRLLRCALPSLRAMVADEVRNWSDRVWVQRSQELREFVHGCCYTVRIRDLFEKAANLILKEVRTSMVRISTYEPDRSLLRSRAL
ncbi:MAG: hypothetical protein AB1744_03975, partial [Candidatus Zixiibacteriota bacterium]